MISTQAAPRTVGVWEVVSAARAAVASDVGGVAVPDRAAFQALKDALAHLDTPIAEGELVAAYMAERATCRDFLDSDPSEQGAALAAWDVARERYAQLLAEYVAAHGLTVGKAEKRIKALVLASAA